MARFYQALLMFLALFISIITAMPAEAGFAIRLEKDVPQSSVTKVNPIEIRIYDSETAATHVASENFGVKDLMLATYFTLAGDTAYRIRTDFTMTDTLTGNMDLWWELWLGGSRMGKRERVPQSAYSLFSVEAVDADTVDGSHAADFAASAHTHVAGDIPTGPGSGLDADTVDGQHASAFAASGHNHDSAYVNVGAADSVTAGMITAGAVSNNHVNAAAAIDYSKLNHPATNHDYTGQFYTQAQVDAIVAALTARLGVFEKYHLAWATEESVESGALRATNPQVEFGNDGIAYAVWQEGDGVTEDIFFSRYIPGSGWEAETPVETSPNPATNPGIAVDGSGNATAVWAEGADIYANRYSMSTGWGTPEPIEFAAGTLKASSLTVVADDDGDVTAAWIQDDGSVNSLFYNRFIPGSGWGSPQPIEPSAFPVRTAHLGGSGSGYLVASWRQDDSPSLPNIYANIYTPGSGWGTATLIQTGTNFSYSPHGAINNAGRAVVTWPQRPGATGRDLWANLYVPGAGWETPRTIESLTGTPLDPYVAIDSKGNAIVVFNYDDGADKMIYANLYTPGTGWATDWETERSIESGTGFTSNPRVLFDPSGGAMALWGEGDVSAAERIIVNRYTPGSGWALDWGTEQLIENQTDTIAYFDFAASPFGSFLAVWGNNTSGDLFSNYFGVH